MATTVTFNIAKAVVQSLTIYHEQMRVFDQPPESVLRKLSAQVAFWTSEGGEGVASIGLTADEVKALAGNEWRLGAELFDKLTDIRLYFAS